MKTTKKQAIEYFKERSKKFRQQAKDLADKPIGNPSFANFVADCCDLAIEALENKEQRGLFEKI